MDLVEIDVIGAETPQAGINGCGNPGAPGPAEAEFGGKHHLIAAPSYGPADELFGLSVAVILGGIKQGDTRLNRIIDDGLGSRAPMRRPKLLHPKPTAETSIPDLPNSLNSILRSLLPGSAAILVPSIG